MIRHYKYYITICCLFYVLCAQHSKTTIETATAGSFLGGKMGTHAINSNPALLGLRSGEIIERTLLDTFMVSYSIRLAVSQDKEELEQIKTKLNQDGFEREYSILKQDSSFSLNTHGFKDSFSAYNFSSNLPLSVPLKTIYSDTTWDTIERPKKYYSIQIFATPNEDTLKLFKKNIKKKIKDFHSEVIFKDSLFKYYVGLFNSEEKAVMLKSDPTIQSISKDAFVVKKSAKLSSGTTPKFSLTLPLRLTLNLQNNHLNTNWFNKYIGADMVQNPSLKNDLINEIPASGINGIFKANSGILDITYLNYGLSLFNINAYYELNIPKELTQVIFDGLRFNDPQEISNLDTKGLVYNETIFSYGRKLNMKQLSFPVYVGVGFRYLNGLFSYTESYEGIITTKEDSVKIFSDMSVIFTDQNQLSSGFGLDLGIYGQFNEKLSAQLSLIGISSYLKSTKGTNWRYVNNINLANSDITEIAEYSETQTDSLMETFTILDTIDQIKDVHVTLPTRLNIATNYSYSDNIHIKGSIQYLTETKLMGKIDPQLSIGTEIFPKKNLSLLSGFSLGGIDRFNFGCGIAIKIKSFNFYIAGSQSGGLLNSASGSSISTECRIAF